MDRRQPRESVVVKLGGTSLAEQQRALSNIAELRAGHDLVIVHGGGNRLTEWLARLGIESRFEDGRRVTDDAALEVALAVFRGVVNGELVGALNRTGTRAAGISGIDGGLLLARRVPHLGRVATVEGADITLLRALLDAGLLPVVAPLALDEDGQVCNVNADEVAAGLAGALGARLVLLTDTDGVLDASGQRLATLESRRAEQLIAEGVISGGMLPKVRGALEALRAGAREVVIANGLTERALEHVLAGHDQGTRMLPATASEAR